VFKQATIAINRTKSDYHQNSPISFIQYYYLVPPWGKGHFLLSKHLDLVPHNINSPTTRRKRINSKEHVAAREVKCEIMKQTYHPTHWVQEHLPCNLVQEARERELVCWWFFRSQEDPKTRHSMKEWERENCEFKDLMREINLLIIWDWACCHREQWLAVWKLRPRCLQCQRPCWDDTSPPMARHRCCLMKTMTCYEQGFQLEVAEEKRKPSKPYIPNHFKLWKEFLPVLEGKSLARVGFWCLLGLFFLE